MLSLLRWGFGTGCEHLTEKERIKAVEKSNPHASNVMVPTQVKRKRGDSVQSQSPSQQRSAKRGVQPGHTRTGSFAGMASTIDHAESPTVYRNEIPVLGNSTFASPFADSHIQIMDDYQPPTSKPKMDTISKETPPVKDEPMQVDSSDIPDVSKLSQIQQVITEQFNLDILMKHNELRLIDQEIAKCQVALEQLRRCSITPHPSITGELTDRLNVSEGIGLPLRPSYGHTSPRHPAPWGVTDGPYTRHYSRWLLPDPEFDGGAVEEVPLSARAGKVGFDRRQRGSIVESPRNLLARGRRGSHGSRLQALSAGYPAPREEKGLAVVTRQSDKKLVKLVCMDCGRENFNSAQGFINHCRIAHSRSFASHEAAAQTVGVEIDAPPADSAIAQTPLTARPEIQTPGSTKTTHAEGPARRLLPIVPTISTPVPRHSISPAPRSAAAQAQALTTPAPRVQVQGNTSATVSAASTPNLSKLFAKSGIQGNLNDMISEATTKPNFDEHESDSDAEEDSNFEDSDAQSVVHAIRAPARTVVRSGMSPAPSGRPHSRKGLDRSTRIDTKTPSTRGGDGHARQQTTLHLVESPPNDLSPHTVESNNAPSLVSDSDGDDDYETGSASSGPSSEADEGEEDNNIDVDIEMEDVGERNGHVHPGVSVPGKSHDPELKTSGKAKAAQRNGYRGSKTGAAPKRNGVKQR